MRGLSVLKWMLANRDRERNTLYDAPFSERTKQAAFKLLTEPTLDECVKKYDGD